MFLFSDVLPELKASLARTGSSEAAERMVSRFVRAFCLHSGRMSCLAVDGIFGANSVHRANTARFLTQVN